MRRALLVFGTRPEAIKMAPVVRALKAHEGFEVTVCVTGQHRGMLDQVLHQFDVQPDADLDLMTPGQSLGEITARVLQRMPAVLRSSRADVVVVQGDTTTAMATAMAAFYDRVQVAHVEAGLRSGRLDAPFPEELNRVWIDQVADYVYPPTALAAEALAGEGRDGPNCLVTGNTSIDALLDIHARLDTLDLPVRDAHGDVERLVLVTAHRRESFGEPLRNVMSAVSALADSHPDVTFVYPVHPNPAVVETAKALDGKRNVRLIAPVEYAELVWLLDRAELVLTDSGGIQEEAPNDRARADRPARRPRSAWRWWKRGRDDWSERIPTSSCAKRRGCWQNHRPARRWPRPASSSETAERPNELLLIWRESRPRPGRPTPSGLRHERGPHPLGALAGVQRGREPGTAAARRTADVRDLAGRHTPPRGPRRGRRQRGRLRGGRATGRRHGPGARGQPEPGWRDANRHRARAHQRQRRRSPVRHGRRSHTPRPS